MRVVLYNVDRQGRVERETVDGTNFLLLIFMCYEFTNCV